MAALLVQSVEAEHLKSIVPVFGPGDTVRVHAKVVEGNRERIQVFEGVVIRRRAGGINENFTVRRIASHGVGVERTFLIHSPRIDKIEVVRHGRVRRAKLYYLRDLTGKAARIKERRRPQRTISPVVNASAPLEEEALQPLEDEITTIPESDDQEADDAAAAAEEASVTEEDDTVEENAAVDGVEENEARP